ncbi:MAG: FtsL-like putative cell division protein [Bacteroidota bacterium]
MNRPKNIASEEKKEEQKPTKKNWFSRGLNTLLNGEFLTKDGVTKHLPFMLFLAGLFVIFISLGYQFEQTERQKVRVKRELEEAMTEYKSLKSQLETRKQQSSVLDQIDRLQLTEPTSPPEIIEVDAGYFEK